MSVEPPVGLYAIDTYCPARAPAWTRPHDYEYRQVAQPHRRWWKRWAGVMVTSRHEVCRFCHWDRTAGRSWWDYLEGLR